MSQQDRPGNPAAEKINIRGNCRGLKLLASLGLAGAVLTLLFTDSYLWPVFCVGAAGLVAAADILSDSRMMTRRRSAVLYGLGTAAGGVVVVLISLFDWIPFHQSLVFYAGLVLVVLGLAVGISGGKDPESGTGARE